MRKAIKDKIKFTVAAIFCLCFFISWLIPHSNYQSLTDKHKHEFVGLHGRLKLVRRVDETIILEYSETYAKVYYVAYGYAGVVCEFEWLPEFNMWWQISSEVIWHSTAKNVFSSASQNKIVWPYFYHNWFINIKKEDVRNPVQEEFQIEMLALLNKQGVYVASYSGLNTRDYIVEELGEGVIYTEELKIYLHIYKLLNPDRNSLTGEEVISLYYSYNEDTYVRFSDFDIWFRGFNGRSDCDTFLDAIEVVMRQYEQKTGNEFKDKTFAFELTLDDILELETYAKENPDFENEDRDYKRLLEWLGVEWPEEVENEV